jgi:large subunit ribosomal protein L21
VRFAAPSDAARNVSSKTQEKHMYAVVSSGGKQYRVEAGSELIVERVPGETGSVITFDRVLLVGDGEAVTVGTPTVEGATVSATVLGETLGPKLIVFKFKQKAHYRRKNGHRQHLTRVRIDEISAGGKRSAAAKAETADAPARAEAKRASTKKAPAKADATAKADDETAKKPARRTRASAETSEPKAASAEAKPKTTRRRSTAKKAEPAADTEAEE